MSIRNNIGLPIKEVNRNSDSLLYQNSDMSIGERVRNARKDAKLTQQQLADKVGIKQSTISELERGDSIGSGHLPAIAVALGVNGLWLQTGRGSPKLDPNLSSRSAAFDFGASPTLTPGLVELIALFSQCSEKWQEHVLVAARTGAAKSREEVEER